MAEKSEQPTVSNSDTSDITILTFVKMAQSQSDAAGSFTLRERACSYSRRPHCREVCHPLCSSGKSAQAETTCPPQRQLARQLSSPLNNDAPSPDLVLSPTSPTTVNRSLVPGLRTMPNQSPESTPRPRCYSTPVTKRHSSRAVEVCYVVIS